MQISDFSFVILLGCGFWFLVLLWELLQVQDLGLDLGLSIRISNNRLVASGGQEPMVTLVCRPQGIAGSDGLPGDKGELVSMSEPLTAN